MIWNGIFYNEIEIPLKFYIIKLFFPFLALGPSSDSGNLATTPTQSLDIQNRISQVLGSRDRVDIFSANALQSGSKKHKAPEIFQDRQLLTLDFVTDYNDGIENDIGALSCVPVYVKIYFKRFAIIISVSGIEIFSVKLTWFFFTFL